MSTKVALWISILILTVAASQENHCQGEQCLGEQELQGLEPDREAQVLLLQRWARSSSAVDSDDSDGQGPMMITGAVGDAADAHGWTSMRDMLRGRPDVRHAAHGPDHVNHTKKHNDTIGSSRNNQTDHGLHLGATQRASALTEEKERQKNSLKKALKLSQEPRHMVRQAGTNESASVSAGAKESASVSTRNETGGSEAPPAVVAQHKPLKTWRELQREDVAWPLMKENESHSWWEVLFSSKHLVARRLVASQAFISGFASSLGLEGSGLYMLLLFLGLLLFLSLVGAAVHIANDEDEEDDIETRNCFGRLCYRTPSTMRAPARQPGDPVLPRVSSRPDSYQQSLQFGPFGWRNQSKQALPNSQEAGASRGSQPPPQAQPWVAFAPPQAQPWVAGGTAPSMPAGNPSVPPRSPDVGAFALEPPVPVLCRSLIQSQSESVFTIDMEHLETAQGRFDLKGPSGQMMLSMTIALLGSGQKEATITTKANQALGSITSPAKGTTPPTMIVKGSGGTHYGDLRLVADMSFKLSLITDTRPQDILNVHIASATGVLQVDSIVTGARLGTATVSEDGPAGCEHLVVRICPGVDAAVVLLTVIGVLVFGSRHEQPPPPITSKLFESFH